MGEEADVVAMSQFQLAPSIIQAQSREHTREILSEVQDLLGRLTSLRMQHLFMIQASPRYSANSDPVISLSQLSSLPKWLCCCYYHCLTCLLGMLNVWQRCCDRRWSRQTSWCSRAPWWLRKGRKPWRNSPNWSLGLTCWQGALGNSRNWYYVTFYSSVILTCWYFLYQISMNHQGTCFWIISIYFCYCLLQIVADISKKYHQRPVNLMGVNI